MLMDDPLCLFHFPQSNQKAFLFHPRLFKMELELNPEILRIQTFLVAYKFYKQTPSHGFASKNPPAYHGWVKILPSILNSIQSVNHWEWSLYSEFYIKKTTNFPGNQYFWQWSMVMSFNIRNPFCAKFSWWDVFYLWGDLESFPRNPISGSNWTTFYVLDFSSEDFANKTAIHQMPNVPNCWRRPICKFLYSFLHKPLYLLPS